MSSADNESETVTADQDAREAFYDREIAPELLGLAKACEARGLSFVATVGWGPQATGITATIRPHAALALRLAHCAARSHGNVDAIIIAMMKYGRQDGHSSIFLKQLGIPFGAERTP